MIEFAGLPFSVNSIQYDISLADNIGNQIPSTMSCVRVTRVKSGGDASKRAAIDNTLADLLDVLAEPVAVCRRI